MAMGNLKMKTTQILYVQQIPNAHFKCFQLVYQYMNVFNLLHFLLGMENLKLNYIQNFPNCL
jgi:hypothetical protein